MTSDESWTLAELKAALGKYETELRQSGKARSTIHTYVQHPERFLDWLGRRSSVAGGLPGGSKRSSKYLPLCEFLSNVRESEISVSFAEIESILGFPLPESARKYPAWWANEQSGSHSHASAWIEAGWETTKANLRDQAVVFRRARV